MSQPPLDLLCIEPRYPGRLGGVADWLVRRRGYRVRFFCHQVDSADRWPEATGRGIEVVTFNVGGLARQPSVEWPDVLERSLCYSYGCSEVLDALRPRPVDVVLGRSDGLGSSLFAPVSFPGAPVVQFFDSYFDPDRREPGDEADLGPEAYRRWRLAANAIELVELENGVTPWTPTEYQRGLFPAIYRNDFHVLHDGVETRNLPRRNREPLTIGGRTIPADARVVSFVARSLDRLRGFDRFVGIVDRLIRDEPNLIAVALGARVVEHPFDFAHHGRDYPSIILGDRAPSSLERLWLPGLLPTSEVRRLLARSDLHISASRPHPASRSLVEAMAAGCVVLAFETEAALEFIEPGHTGLIAPPDLEEATRIAIDILRHGDQHRPLGDRAADRVRESYSRDATLPRLAALFDRLASERR